ncbi:unnamed protein product [Caenorhabditis auriculariae]|uniref:Caveolin n=1 Tax=Caenorhabditis auriculariae TaxID=2777116 RepID=A0A8S1HS71_9PELO|nr:unnamed protein product [Caenorhabditis auriculariae]
MGKFHKASSEGAEKRPPIRSWKTWRAIAILRMSRKSSSSDSQSSPPNIVAQYDTVEEVEILEPPVVAPREIEVLAHAEEVPQTDIEAPPRIRHSIQKTEVSSLPLPQHPAVTAYAVEPATPVVGAGVTSGASSGSGGGKKGRGNSADRRDGPADESMVFDLNGEPIKPVMAHKMNMQDRDLNHSAQFLNNNFFEIFAEPGEQYHSIACVWTVSYRFFEITKIYTYKILSLLFGIILAVLAGFLFALFTFLNVWVIRPVLFLARTLLHQVLYIWPTIVVYVLRPCFYATGAVFSSVRLHQTSGTVIREVWEDHVHTV